jgi:hypothetical protein
MARTLGVLALVLGVGAVAQAQVKDTRTEAAPPAPAMTAEGKKFLAGWLGQRTANDVAMTMGDQKMQGAPT